VHQPSPDAAPLDRIDATTALGAWNVAPPLVAGLALVAAVYARGWRRLQTRRPGWIGGPHLVAFLGGLVALFLALASPLDVLADRSLLVHMAQHIVLLAVAPPLLLLGAPLVPLLCGLPAGRYSRAMFARCARWADQRLGHPAIGLLAMSLATWGWHVPAAFELALRVRVWHIAEHASFLTAGLLFWWPVVCPWPARRRFPAWGAVAYLLLADVQNTALAALLVFSGRSLYPSYGTGARALDQQIGAGILMWVPMSLVYLVPAIVITVRWLSPGTSPGQGAARRLAASASSRKSARLPARAASATGSLEADDSSASRATPAFAPPNAATQTSVAPASGTSVSVTRLGGGFGESSMATTVRTDSSSARWPGKREQT
jgi:putative membrane protein